jgi:hypothetical protein
MENQVNCYADNQREQNPTMETYSSEIEAAMRQFYASLNERDRRRYAGLEALKLGHGGQNYIARVLGCSRRTVHKGAQEISGLSNRAVMEQIGSPPLAGTDSAGGRRTQTLLGDAPGVGRTVYERVAESYRRGSDG